MGHSGAEDWTAARRLGNPRWPAGSLFCHLLVPVKVSPKRTTLLPQSKICKLGLLVTLSCPVSLWLYSTSALKIIEQSEWIDWEKKIQCDANDCFLPHPSTHPSFRPLRTCPLSHDRIRIYTLCFSWTFTNAKLTLFMMIFMITALISKQKSRV